MKQLWAPWRMAYVAGDEPDDGTCFICAARDATGAAGRLVVERAEQTVTLLNRFPYSPGHVMVAPARHVTDPRDLDGQEGGAMFSAMQRAMRALSAAMNPDGFNAGLNLGSAAGSSIDHLHLHVVPRWGGDTNFMPVLGDVKVIPEHLEATAAKLRDAYEALDADKPV
jgi:ATP adenylyltransferase